MERVLDWFTPDRRKRFYGIVVVILAVLTGHGVITSDDAAHAAEALGYLLGAGAVTLARKNINDE